MNIMKFTSNTMHNFMVLSAMVAAGLAISSTVSAANGGALNEVVSFDVNSDLTVTSDILAHPKSLKLAAEIEKKHSEFLTPKKTETIVVDADDFCNLWESSHAFKGLMDNAIQGEAKGTWAERQYSKGEPLWNSSLESMRSVWVKNCPQTLGERLEKQKQHNPK